MKTEITDINDLSSLSGKLNTMSEQLGDSVSQLNSIIKQARDYDGIDVTAAGNTLRKNLKIVASDMKNVARNINDYTNGINVLDKDDISTEADTFSLSNVVDGVGAFFTSVLPSSVTEPVKNIATGIEIVGENIIDAITSPVSLAVGAVTGKNNNQTEDGSGENH